MRTVLSQPGNLKAGQATILISQPTLPQVAVSSTQGLTAAQVSRELSSNFDLVRKNRFSFCLKLSEFPP